jgi:hypothetical protein
VQFCELCGSVPFFLFRHGLIAEISPQAHSIQHPGRADCMPQRRGPSSRANLSWSNNAMHPGSSACRTFSQFHFL